MVIVAKLNVQTNIRVTANIKEAIRDSIQPMIPCEDEGGLSWFGARVVRILLILERVRLSLIIEVMLLSAVASLILDSTGPTKCVFLRGWAVGASVGQRRTDMFPFIMAIRCITCTVSSKITWPFKVTTTINHRTTSITKEIVPRIWIQLHHCNIPIYFRLDGWQRDCQFQFHYTLMESPTKAASSYGCASLDGRVKSALRHFRGALGLKSHTRRFCSYEGLDFHKYPALISNPSHILKAIMSASAILIVIITVRSLYVFFKLIQVDLYSTSRSLFDFGLWSWSLYQHSSYIVGLFAWSYSCFLSWICLL